jgi:tetratricopeptide (TPR) repeat protein
MFDCRCHIGTPERIGMLVLSGCLFTGSVSVKASIVPPISEETTNGVDLAVQLKNRGDKIYQQHESKAAAELYLKALATAHDNTFSAEQLNTIALRLMEGGVPAEAERIFRKLSAEQPGNNAIRLNLAKALVKQEDWEQAIVESEKILVADDLNLQALLIKADCLSKQKKYSEAIQVYHLILENENDFEARVGLTYSLMAIGQNAEAQKNILLVNDEEKWQEQELEELSHEFNSVTQPIIELINNNYSDSDNNATSEYGFSVKSDIKDWALTSGYLYKSASGNLNNDSAESFYASAARNINDHMRLTGTLGLSVLSRPSSTILPTGQLKLDTHLGEDALTLNFTEDTLTTTAALIGNALQMSQFGFTVKHPLTRRINLTGGYLFKDVSDGNTANDLQASAQYTVFKKQPSLMLAYKYRYLNFDHPAHHSYFDPQDFNSHALALMAGYENSIYYTNLGLELGRQSFWRNNQYQSNLYGYANLSVGIKPTRNLLLECNMEGSNSAAAQSANGFTYYIIGARFSYMF